MWALTTRVYIVMRAWRRSVLGPGPSVPPALRPGQSRPAPKLECSAPRPSSCRAGQIDDRPSGKLMTQFHQRAAGAATCPTAPLGLSPQTSTSETGMAGQVLLSAHVRWRPRKAQGPGTVVVNAGAGVAGATGEALRSGQTVARALDPFVTTALLLRPEGLAVHPVFASCGSGCSRLLTCPSWAGMRPRHSERRVRPPMAHSLHRVATRESSKPCQRRYLRKRDTPPTAVS